MAAKAPARKSAPPVKGSAWRDDPAYSVAAAALAIGISRKALYDYLNARRIGHVQIGGQKFIRQSHIDAFLARGEVKAV
jgi:hypothetical protein